MEYAEKIEIFNPHLFHEKAAKLESSSEISEALVFLEEQLASINNISSRYVDCAQLRADTQIVVVFLKCRMKKV